MAFRHGIRGDTETKWAAMMQRLRGIFERGLILGVGRTAMVSVLLAPSALAGASAAHAPSIAPPNGAAIEPAIELSRELLESPATRDDHRVSAAQVLLKAGPAVCSPSFARVLRADDPAGHVIVLRTIVEAGDTGERISKALSDDILSTLGSADENVLGMIGRIFETGDNAMHEAVALRALADQTPVAERVGAIRVLGIMSTRESAKTLMQLIPERPASTNDGGDDDGKYQVVRDAVFASLAKIAPNDFGDNTEDWQAWWEIAQGQDESDWWRSQRAIDLQAVTDLRAQTAWLQAELDALREGYVNTLRDLYVILPATEQAARLSRDLVDPRPFIRRFALGRIERMLIDSEPVSEQIRKSVLALVTDDEQAIRLKAAAILDELDDESLVPRIATLLDEPEFDRIDHATQNAWLEILARRPSPEFVRFAEDRIGREHLVASSCELLRAILEAAPTDDAATRTLREEIAGIARHHLQSMNGPDVLTLMAYAGDESDRALLQPMLNGVDREAALAVAHGFAAAGEVARLMQYADVVPLQPIIARAISRGPADNQAVRLILELEPEDPTNEIGLEWDRAVRTLASRLDPADTMTLDDSLSDEPLHDRLRIAVLTGIVVSAPGDENAVSRKDALLRAIPILERNGEATRAKELIGLVDTSGNDEDFAAARRRLAMRTADFGEEELPQPLVGSTFNDWHDACVVITKDDPVRATLIVGEIRKRFETRTPEQETKLADLQREVEAALASSRATSGNAS